MKKFWLFVACIAAALLAVWFFFLRGAGTQPEIEYRYEAAHRGEITRSISANGLIVPLTAVDVKSKAGGIVEHLAVDEGSVVKKGDLVAEIDPRDTKALYEQAQADLQSSQARASQAGTNLSLQRANTRTSIASAETAVETARVRLERAQLEANRQPDVSQANLTSAQASFDSASEELDRFQNVTAQQQRRDVQGAFDKAQADLNAAKADYQRQQDLMKAGYVSQAVVERAKSALESAQSAFNTAQQRRSTLDRDLAAQRRSFEFAKSRAQASLNQAKADMAQVGISNASLNEARKAYDAAKIDLQQAKDAAANNQIRAEDKVAAQAATVRSKVALQNAQVQLQSTTVVAPRDGVVTLKYLEEGTIIPPGTSTFAQGTSIVQISDVSTLFVDCNVDEADIGAVQTEQPVRIVSEAFPGQKFDGVVERVSPAAKTDQNITSVKVRVRILPGFNMKLLPGLNATCEFITFSKKDVLIVPAQALQREGDKTFVKVKNPKGGGPLRREVKAGASGDNGVEILEGLKDGEEVVTAEIDLAALRDTQQKMLEAQQGGGLAGGMGGPQRRPQGGATGGRGGAGGAGGMGGSGAGGGGARGGGGGGK